MEYLSFSFYFKIVFHSHKPNLIFLNFSTTQILSTTLQPVSEYGYKPKPAQLRGEGWEVSEGRGGGMTRHLSDNFPPPLSSESRPEGHPLYGHREYHPAVGRRKNPLLKLSYQPNRCKQKQYENHLPLSMTIEPLPRCQANEKPK